MSEKGIGLYEAIVVNVPASLNQDLKTLALAVLRGDEIAANPLVDCWLENTSGKRERITPDYVHRLEDELRHIKYILTKANARADDPYNFDIPLYYSEYNLIYSNLFKLERYARELGRQGLS